MKKIKLQRTIIFILLSLSLLVFSSQSIAGSNTKLTNSTNDTSVKDTQKVQSKQKQKTEAHSSTTSKSKNVSNSKVSNTTRKVTESKSATKIESSNLTGTKSTAIKKNTTSDNKKNKTEVKISTKIKKSTNSKANTQNEKLKANISKKTVTNTATDKSKTTSNKTTSVKKSNLDVQEYNTLKSKSIKNSKSNANLKNSEDNDMIKNPLNNDTNTSQASQHVVHETLELDELDDDTHTVSYGNVKYKCHNGYYYEPWNGHFRRIPPPFGMRTRWLPRHHYNFIFHECVYFYCCNVFYIYIEDDDEYVIVRPPIGALVDSIPEYSEQLIIEGETYYIADGIQYKAVMVNDEIWYKVIKVLESNENEIVQLQVGTLVDTIPEDRELLLIDGETYYIAEDIQYKVVIVNEEIWFKILKVG